MTTLCKQLFYPYNNVVEAYRLGKYDNFKFAGTHFSPVVVEAYRLGKYDNKIDILVLGYLPVVEAYRLGKYDNPRMWSPG